MLLRFSAANHLSLKEPQELSLTASSLKDAESGLIEWAASPDGRVLPAVVIYGANASGKSNVVAAFRFMRQAVLASHRRGEPGGGVRRTPFALDPACEKLSTSFLVDFVVEGVRYHYGFEASNEAFTAEWLYAFPHGRRQMLFERDGGSFEFGRSLRGRNRIIADLTRPNSLFLSAARQNDHEDLSNVSDFFRTLRVMGITTEIPAWPRREIDSRIVTFLEKIGTGIIGSRPRKIEVPPEIQAMQLEIATVTRKFDTSIGGDLSETVVIELGHQGSTGEPIYFQLQRESAGTRRLLGLLDRAFRVLDEGTLLVIDELDASLHTQACEAVLALFCSRTTNPKGAQLIATTHDTNLLRSTLLRRDQIWFSEKDPEGATHLYPLTDIRTRKGDNLEKGYLQGRYGAIPFAGSVSDFINAA